MPSNDKRTPRVPRSALAGTLLERLTGTYAQAADPVRAEAMAAYMKDVAPFLGIPTPLRRELSKAVTRGAPVPSESDCAALALGCWRLPEREYHYFAVDYLRRHVARCSSGFLPVVRHLVVTVPWWDTVDLLAAHTVGPLVAADPGLGAVMDEWIEDEDLWLARTALLHQLRYKGATDGGRLFAHCRRRAGDSDFFLRKAIGWALREYAKTDPTAVRAFVEAERGSLSPLSVREALKNL
ncbi:DNA alkylation repair protein [Streptomyces sp. NPDC085524]|uniref:DNA alkylation repair protein n=1 Tax=Streptomyces sp. NPDC085524 TaxID=3365728 RepID=UPI0037D1EDD5